MGHVESKTAKQKEIVDYQSFLKLEMTIKEIPDFDKQWSCKSAETVTSEDTPDITYCSKIYGHFRCRVKERESFTLTFNDEILAAASMNTVTIPSFRLEGCHMNFVDWDLIGKTPMEAFEKYPGTFTVTKSYRLFTGGWRLENLSFITNNGIKVTLTDLSKVIMKNENQYKIVKIKLP